MAEEKPGSAFGLDAPPDGGLFGSEQPEPAAPQEPAPASAPPREPAAWQAPPEPPAAPEAPVEEQPPAEGERLYAGVFKDVDALEKGYEEARKQFTQRSQELGQIRGELDQQKQVLEAFAPYITQQLLEQNPELAEQMEFQQRLEPLIEERLAPLQEQQQAERAQQAYLAEVGNFYQRHPEIVPNSPQDMELVKVIQELDLDNNDPPMLEVAAEAVQNPVLRFVLQGSPHFVETEAGMAQARIQAQLIAASQGQSAPTPVDPQAQGGTAPRIPFVEHGASGAPVQGAPGAQPQSPLAEAIRIWNEDRSNVFLK